MDTAALLALAEDRLDLRYKGFAPTLTDPTLADLVERRPRLVDAGFSFPLMTLHRAAVEHNVAALADYARAHGVLLAPHGKSTMSPELHAMQLEAGAWGLTAATVHEVAVYRSFGVRRVLLANEVVDDEAVRWLAGQLAADPDFELLVYADSVAGVELLAAAADGICPPGRMGVLVEVGYPGGRTGCRTVQAALAVAGAVDAATPLRLAGVSGYEGLLGREATPQTLTAVKEFVGSLREVAAAILADRRTEPDVGFVVSGGGSAFFDVVTEELTGGWPDAGRVTVILRCGSYVTHDDGLYEHASPFARLDLPGGPLRAGLHLWAHVLSVPDPDRAIVAAGRRDLPFDAGLPRPKLVWRRGGAAPQMFAGATTAKVNDHHAYVDTTPAEPLGVGDLVGFGISHPCTAFDKWRMLPMLDDQWHVVGAAHTFF